MTLDRLASLLFHYGANIGAEHIRRGAQGMGSDGRACGSTTYMNIYKIRGLRFEVASRVYFYSGAGKEMYEINTIPTPGTKEIEIYRRYVGAGVPLQDGPWISVLQELEDDLRLMEVKSQNEENQKKLEEEIKARKDKELAIQKWKETYTK